MTAPPTSRIVAPHPGAYLSERQGQRAECFRLVIELVAGRSVPIGTVWQIAQWLYQGEPPAPP